MMLYLLIAGIHVAESIWSGNYSRAWDSWTELVLFGLNSERSSELSNTGAGASRAATFAQPVHVRVDEEKRVVMVFGDVPSRMDPVRNNASYG